MKSLAASVLQIAGIAAVSYGAWTIAHWAGYIVAGVGLFAIGFVMDLPTAPKPKRTAGGES